jgi:hypothetical protein
MSEPNEILADLETGDVVLIGGQHPMWRNCLLLVSEVRRWGVVGSVRGPNDADYPLRVGGDNIVAVFREHR